MATCGIGRGQIGGMTTAAGDNNGREEEAGTTTTTTTTNQRGRGRGIVFRRGGRRGRRGRGTTIEGEEEKERKE